MKGHPPGAVADTTAFACCLFPPRLIVISQIIRSCYRLHALQLIIDVHFPADMIENASYDHLPNSIWHCVALQVDKRGHAFYLKEGERTNRGLLQGKPSSARASDMMKNIYR